MKKLLFSIMVILIMSAGCTFVADIVEVVNQPPTAYIDSISPTDASVGESVTFDGHGTDADGTVVAYRWRSSLDGDLSAKASFDTSSLSVGEHTIYLKVQDNTGAWSDEVRSRVTVFGGAAGAPVINAFGASPGSITSGASSTLSWNVSNATAVSIDKGVGSVAVTAGTTAVSPFTTTQYTLTATNAAGSVTATTQVIVSGAPPPGLPVISSFIPNPPVITAGDSSTLSWNVSNATSVTIDQGVGAVAPVGSTSVSPAATTSYTLTATNAAGWSSATTVVLVMAAPPGDLPVINSFTANPGNITAGDSSTLSWNVSNADTLTLTGEITKTLGSMVGSSDVSPDATITYTLTATNAAGSIIATVQVVVAPAGHTVTLFSIEGEDGHVNQGGGTSAYPNVGDNSAGQALQAFLSFDTSGIPCGATVTSASLDLSTGDMLGDPFGGLGWMRVYSDPYGSLDGGDFTPGFPMGAIYTYNSRPVAPFTSSGLTSAVQAVTCAMVPRFRVRIQFQSYTDGDPEVDCLRLGEGKPKLVITYEE